MKQAELDGVVETRDAQHARQLVERLVEAGFPTRTLIEGTEAT